MKSFYPSTTNKIIHKGKSGNIYKLDGIQKCISLSEELDQDPNFSIQSVSIKNDKDIQEATNLINSVHTPDILEAYKTGLPSELANASGIMWQPDLYNFVLESALVSKYSVDEALKNNKALAIVGGGHHAEISKPFGFCTINTMAISAIHAINNGYKVAILDLDTHYSNGCFDILHPNKNASVYSIWNQKLDRWKYYESSDNMQNYKVENVDDYFSKLNLVLENISKNAPDLLIYHLGLDVLETDRMGGVKGMEEKHIIEREKLVKGMLDILKVPFVVFLGGGYIDWSRGGEYAVEQRRYLTGLQHRLLNTLFS